MRIMIDFLFAGSPVILMDGFRGEAATLGRATPTTYFWSLYSWRIFSVGDPLFARSDVWWSNSQCGESA